MRTLFAKNKQLNKDDVDRKRNDSREDVFSSEVSQSMRKRELSVYTGCCPILN